jgi:arylsulfatase B
MRAASLLAGAALAAAAAPKVVFTVIVDDLGWGNVAWHGNASQNREPIVSTPHSKALASEGITLDRHYGFYECTPSRSAFLTGRLPMHVQQTLANPDTFDAGIPYNMTSVAEKLRDAGWATHIYGKWDLGFATQRHTPLGRGFDESLVSAETPAPAECGSDCDPSVCTAQSANPPHGL